MIKKRKVNLIELYNVNGYVMADIEEKGKMIDFEVTKKKMLSNPKVMEAYETSFKDFHSLYETLAKEEPAHLSPNLQELLRNNSIFDEDK